jgi:NAD(P)-dependent dehydrogenase (short-subunit alcohol dehydrogenase family)
MRLANKVAVVTGGAAGIGKASAERFAAEGATVIAADKDQARATGVVADMLSVDQHVVFFSLDVASETQWMHLVESVERDYGGIDILLNNAGIELMKPLVETTLEEWNHVMSVNVTGTFLGMKHVIPVMMRRGGGSIINMSSEAGFVGTGCWAAYTASKGAVRLLTKDVALEFAGYGVRVNSIHPGIIQTEMWDRLDALLEADSATSKGSALPSVPPIPLCRRGTPGEVANLALFLASDESSYCTGSEFVVDGGDTCR